MICMIVRVFGRYMFVDEYSLTIYSLAVPEQQAFDAVLRGGCAPAFIRY